MLHYDSEFRQQLASEHARGLAHDLRRARRLAPDEARSSGWARLWSRLVRRRRRLLQTNERSVPAYHA